MKGERTHSYPRKRFVSDSCFQRSTGFSKTKWPKTTPFEMCDGRQYLIYIAGRGFSKVVVERKMIVEQPARRVAMNERLCVTD